LLALKIELYITVVGSTERKIFSIDILKYDIYIIKLRSPITSFDAETDFKLIIVIVIIVIIKKNDFLSAKNEKNVFTLDIINTEQMSVVRRCVSTVKDVHTM